MRLHDRIESIVNNNCKEVPWEGTEVNKYEIRTQMYELVKEYARLCCEEQIKACNKKVADNLGLAKTPSDYSVLNCPNVVDNE